MMPIPLSASLLIAFLLAMLSLGLYLKQLDRWAILTLFGAALVLRYWMVNLDPFMHQWDEQFHAVVAKNMMRNPFKPILRMEPIWNIDYTKWCCNHIWLHKQPLFLWQIALSMKLFGVNLFALRLPSLLMGAFLIFPIWRIGNIVFNRRTAYFTAFLFCFSYYQLEVGSGTFGMDHNDTAFLFYVTMSLWAFFEMTISPHRTKWILLVGLFSGAAILCKWLTGLLVFSGWGLWILVDEIRRSDRRFYLHAIQALAVSILVFLPWQIYTQIRFPLEAAFERNYNTEHVFKALEGHTGTWTYYLDNLPDQYGGYLWILLALGLGLMLFSHKKKEIWPFLAFIFIPWFFFSIIAQTKMPSFLIIISPLAFMMMAASIDFLSKRIKPFFFSPILLLICTYFVFNPYKIAYNHFPKKVNEWHLEKIKNHKINNAKIHRELNTIVPKDYIILNGGGELSQMFFSDRMAWSWFEKDLCDFYISKGYKIAAFKNNGNYRLPLWIYDYPDFLLIDRELK